MSDPRTDAAGQPGSAEGPPGRNCPRCARLVAFRQTWREKEPSWFNAPVPTWGDPRARLVIVGLAPGLRGANRTGRPFTGDYAGNLLYGTMAKFGFAEGAYRASPDDGLRLVDAAITNAVRCVPPQNKPNAEEINLCRPFLQNALTRFERLEVVLALGRIAHDSLVRALGYKPSRVPFGHAAVHRVDRLDLFDSYHCSRYNTNTGRLTPEMFETVFAAIRHRIGESPG